MVPVPKFVEFVRGRCVASRGTRLERLGVILDPTTGYSSVRGLSMKPVLYRSSFRNTTFCSKLTSSSLIPRAGERWGRQPELHTSQGTATGCDCTYVACFVVYCSELEVHAPGITQHAIYPCIRYLVIETLLHVVVIDAQLERQCSRAYGSRSKPKNVKVCMCCCLSVFSTGNQSVVPFYDSALK